MSEWWKDSDPQAEQEASRYANPIPSRQFIMQFLEERGLPVNHNAICQGLGVTEEQQEALMYRLKAMIRDGQLLQDRKGSFVLMSKLDLIKGRVQGHKEGYGFLVPDDGGGDLYLSAREMRQVFDGDRALVCERGLDRRGRKEGKIVEVLERNTIQIVGRYFEDSGVAYVIPENTRIGREVIVTPGPLMAVSGQYVLLEIIEQPGRRSLPVGLVKEILGDRSDAGMEVEVALRTHDIPHVWSDEVKKECEKFNDEVLDSDKRDRVDLREVPFVTIDGEDARDFDDAVCCEVQKGGGWRLYVAIADVSHYVRVNSALDVEAKERGTSVYFPGHVVPMLPEVLSNGLCSLNPEVDRLAMVCEMTISAEGTLSGYIFYEGLIRSHARLTYEQVWEMLSMPLSSEGEALRRQRVALVPHIEELYCVYQALRKVRETRGAIDFDTVETRIVFGENRKIDRIVPTERNEAHKLIEECMLCANVVSARFLEHHGIPGLFRVHEGPTMEKRLNLNNFLGSFGLSVPAGAIKPKDIQALMEIVRTRPDAHVIQTVVLRSMSQAVYTASNQGHFGLAFQAYTHFTSPIRRYPDLLTHRAIRHIIRSNIESSQVKRTKAKELNKKAIYPYDAAAIETLGEHCSRTERRADEATRDATDWLKCEYMQQHLGQDFKGVVSSVTGFGLFVELKDIFVEGLVHISSLPGDYYHFDAIHHRLNGERTGTSFRLGDEINVTVSRVSQDDKKIDFELSSSFGSVNAGNKRGIARNGGNQSRTVKSTAAKAWLLSKAKAAQEADEKAKGSKSDKKRVSSEHTKKKKNSDSKKKRVNNKAGKKKVEKSQAKKSGVSVEKKRSGLRGRPKQKVKVDN
ncbi:MAG: ribonuclease R [Candidatus Endonucleobacter bathymodioli]|uniref:Ribonuclease R n=1 Tax=Candidatus Endonucleibacter bathymodioli TaxID=539814 RepID=A0AA90NM89_9GAMM|nr:ribonuclease R [Candidatus Endonucleobacter bathymodioli]